MRRARWLAPWKDSAVRPAMYHCLSRVVDRRFVFSRGFGTGVERPVSCAVLNSR